MLTNKMTYEAAAARLDISVRTLKRLVYAKRIGCYRTGCGRSGARVFFDQKHLDGYEASCEQRDAAA